MEVSIFQTSSRDIGEETVMKTLLLSLPFPMQKRALRYKFRMDAKDYVAGKALLRSALARVKSFESLKDVLYEDNGKPYLKTIDFNISHSANRVLLAFSQQGKLGIDVEQIKPIVLADFRSFFTNEEWLDIENNTEPFHRFYWYWTRKESIIKALGITLAYLHQIEIDPTQDYFVDKGKKWFLRDLDLSGHFVGSICTEFVIDKLVFESVSVIE